jgi:integrase
MDAMPGAVTARYVKRNTEKAFDNQVKSVGLFFGGRRLEEIDWCSMREYQKARIAGVEPFVRYRRPQDAKSRTLKDGTIVPAKGKESCRAKPQQVNQEMQLLKRLKKFAGCWTAEDQRWFKYLQEEESDAERALTPEQQTLWLEMSRAKERWSVIFWYCLVAFHTTASTNELRGLRLGDVRRKQEVIVIPWPCAKNKGRKRTITIDDPDADWGLKLLLERAAELGATEPQHYLFPAWDPRANRYLPEQPMSNSGLKRKWEELQEATGLENFRAYDTRHTGITRMAENGVPIDVIMSRAGHLSDVMRQHYTHISQAAQRRWMRDASHRGYWQQRPPEMGFAPRPARAMDEAAMRRA